MKNVKEVAVFAKKNKKLFWIDGCRIFENAAFIKAFEPEY
jgi:tryptophanase